MVKIKAKNLKVSGMKLCVPVDGVIDIDANGYADVSEKAAKILVSGTNDWEYEETSSDDSSENMTTQLKKMSLDELVNLAKEVGYSEDEYSKFANAKKNAAKLMVAYLTKKYNEAQAAQAEQELKDDEADEKTSSDDSSENKEGSETAEATETSK